jgi:hypothetical protein
VSNDKTSLPTAWRIHAFDRLGLWAGHPCTLQFDGGCVLHYRRWTLY